MADKFEQKTWIKLCMKPMKSTMQIFFWRSTYILNQVYIEDDEHSRWPIIHKTPENIGGGRLISIYKDCCQKNDQFSNMTRISYKIRQILA